MCYYIILNIILAGGDVPLPIFAWKTRRGSVWDHALHNIAGLTPNLIYLETEARFVVTSAAAAVLYVCVCMQGRRVESA